jgi:hypothetical protein
LHLHNQELASVILTYQDRQENLSKAVPQPRYFYFSAINLRLIPADPDEARAEVANLATWFENG